MIGNEALTGRVYFYKTSASECIVEVINRDSLDIGSRFPSTGDAGLNAGSVIGQVWSTNAVLGRTQSMQLMAEDDSFKKASSFQVWCNVVITGTLMFEITS
jgi:hypothetical protein